MCLLSEDDKKEETKEAKAPAAEQAPAAPAKSDIQADSASQELMTKIEEERKTKGMLLDEMRRYRRRLAYKLAEKEALAKINTEPKKGTKNIGYLRRRKESLEFRISTEAFSLAAEKELIRKKQEVEEELQEAINNYRMKRKAEFVQGDIEEMNKKIEETSQKLQELEKRLDVLYGGLRRRRSSQPRQKKQEFHQPQQQEVSFADIAVIKEKKKEAKKDGGD